MRCEVALRLKRNDNAAIEEELEGEKL